MKTNKKILIVDDQNEILELVEVTLGIDYYTIIKARNGAEAVEFAKKEKPDLILMDIKMSGNVDGITAARLIKNNPETRSSKIVMLTASDIESVKEQVNSIDISGYLLKPYSPLELLNKVEELLT